MDHYLHVRLPADVPVPFRIVPLTVDRRSLAGFRAVEMFISTWAVAGPCLLSWRLMSLQKSSVRSSPTTASRFRSSGERSAGLSARTAAGSRHFSTPSPGSTKATGDRCRSTGRTSPTGIHTGSPTPVSYGRSRSRRRSRISPSSRTCSPSTPRAFA